MTLEEPQTASSNNSDQNTEQHVVEEISQQDYAHLPGIFYWLQVVPVESPPKCDHLIQLIQENASRLSTYPSFSERLFDDYVFNEQETYVPVKFSGHLNAHPSFPAAFTFYYDVINANSNAKDAPSTLGITSFYVHLLIHFVAVQAELRQKYVNDRTTHNYSNTLIQSSRKIRRNLHAEVTRFLKTYGLLTSDPTNAEFNDLTDEDKSNIIKTIDLLRSPKPTLNEISEAILTIDRFSQSSADLLPITRLLDYFVEEKELKKRKHSKQPTQRIIREESTTNEGSKSETSMSVISFSPNIIPTPDGKMSPQEIIDRGEAVSEFSETPTIFEESWSSEKDQAFHTSESSLSSTNSALSAGRTRSISSFLSPTAKQSPAKGATGKQQFVIAKDASRHILKQNLRLTESWESLTSSEVQYLLQTLFSLLDKTSEEFNQYKTYSASKLAQNILIADEQIEHAAITLLTSLFLGTKLENLSVCRNIDWIKPDLASNQRLLSLDCGRIFYSPPLPDYKTLLPDEVRKTQAFYTSNQDKLAYLRLPMFLEKKLVEIGYKIKLPKREMLPIGNEIVKTHAEQILKYINHHFHTRLTTSRVANVLHFNVRHLTGDKATLVLLGLSNLQTQSYYANASIAALNEIYRRAIALLPINNLTDELRKNCSDFEIVDDSTRIGSRNLMNQNTVDEIVNKLNELVFRINTNANEHSRHNMMISYSYFMLLFFTGARPVHHLFSSFAQLDIINNLIFVSDKDTVDSYSTRPIPLHPQLLKQLEELKKHLDFYQIIHRPHNLTHCLYLIDEHNQVTNFNLAKIFAILGFDESMPRNLFRAWFRNLMIEKCQFGQHADAILSHWDAGEEYYARYATFDFQQLSQHYKHAWDVYEQHHPMPEILRFITP